ncbi:MAG: sce7726 family protein [Candidatus Hydrogenedentes bacterium]|nr:sce7726 family protein [Candidatus Hydrogenedentota bacterium]
MDDAQIREAFHRSKLRKYHHAANTLVVNELGLKHGRYRADIAVINGHFIGFEIKSDEDSLGRLTEQVQAYSDVFDRVTVVVGIKHADVVSSKVPDWWGVTLARKGPRGGIFFESIRTGCFNKNVDAFSLAQLLWKNEASGILVELDVPRRILRQERSILYELLAESLSRVELRRKVRDCLTRRGNWRCRELPSPSDGLSQLAAM